ncbi:hypothetical protein [Micromonospora sp. NPDC023814]|uniref:hypothetical protein n=1 Tax=Micromonospora sp. NPDC023814 TaxID=3154596 RepID=UPI0033E6E496
MTGAVTERTIPIHADRAREALDAAATAVPLTPAERDQVRDDLRRAEDLTADLHPEGRP